MHLRHADHEHGLAHVVEDEDRVRQQEGAGRRAGLGRQTDAGHERLDGVVGEIADGAALQGRQLGRRREGPRPQRRAHSRQRMFPWLRLDDRRRVDAEIGIAADALAAADALQQKDRLVPDRARQDGDRRLPVRQVLAIDRRPRAIARTPGKLLLRQNLQHAQPSFLVTSESHTRTNARSRTDDFRPGDDSTEPETSMTSAPLASAARTLSAAMPPARTVR